MPDAPDREAAPAVTAEIERIAALLGTRIRDERRHAGLTLARLAERACVSTAAVQKVEAGGRGSLEMYVRLAMGLDRMLDVRVADASVGMRDLMEADDPVWSHPPDAADIVHAAMGELEVNALRAHGFRIGVDEPWQHYQYAGRADVIAWTSRPAALLHFENRTLFPDIQDSIGRFNNKRAFMAGALWQRLGMSGPPVAETHVMVGLWSMEVIEVLRRHAGIFSSLCPDPPDALVGWLRGRPPRAGTTSSLVLLDPFATGSQQRFASLTEVLQGAGPRIAGYAAAAKLVRAGRARVR